MKQRLVALAGLLGLVVLLNAFRKEEILPVEPVTGAWHLQQGSSQQVLIFQDGYLSHTVFDKANKKFISTYGGLYKEDDKTVKLTIEFDTRSKESVGK